MARRRASLFLLLLISLAAFGVIVPVFAPLPSLHSPSHHHSRHHHDHSKFKKVNTRKFEIDDDMFWKDGKPFQIIGGDLHYFRILPEYWEDRLLRAKALGLNTIQTYIPWNLHEPKPGNFTFTGIADIVSFIQLCQKVDFLVLLRAGPYICAEWDLGGFPAWLLAQKPAPRLRSSDPGYLQWVERWWGIILPKVAPLLYNNGGPIIMVQIENEFGSYGDDQAYLHHLVTLARGYLGDEVILYNFCRLDISPWFYPWTYSTLTAIKFEEMSKRYTTDGGTREALEKGTIRGDVVFSAVDFSTGERPWPIFNLQKEFNAPGKSPPLSAEFYTGWLTHWGENIATTDANSTAAALSEILAGKGSAVLYMAHGGTNFGFYNGANTGGDVLDYKPDLTSYDYDAPIKESGDIDNAKYKAIRRVIEHYSGALLPSVPSDNEKIGYGPIHLQKSAFLFDMIHMIDPVDVAASEEPLSMESVDQRFGFLLYATEYAAKDNEDGYVLYIPEVHDRAQVFVSCSSKNYGVRPTSVGIIERWSNRRLNLPNTRCDSNTLYILVENMGHINYGRYVFDRKGILSSVYLDDSILYGWKMISIPFNNLNEILRGNSFSQIAHSGLRKIIARRGLEVKSDNFSSEPALYAGYFYVDKVNLRKDTFLSFAGWTKGIAFVNEFNLGRFWPVVGPQCNLYVPAPILRLGKNVLVVLELESPNPEVVVYSVDRPNFTCGSSKSNLSQLLSHQHSLRLEAAMESEGN